jgi:hypothetical protein
MADLAGLHALIERSVRTATPAVADSVAFPGPEMTAAELVEFIRGACLTAMATGGRRPSRTSRRSPRSSTARRPAWSYTRTR